MKDQVEFDKYLKGNPSTSNDHKFQRKVVAIIDDSLALLTNSRGYEDCHEVFMGSADCERGGTNDGLFLVNYRKKQLPYWGDTTNGHLYLIDGFYRDSVVLFSNDREEFMC